MHRFQTAFMFHGPCFSQRHVNMYINLDVNYLSPWIMSTWQIIQDRDLIGNIIYSVPLIKVTKLFLILKTISCYINKVRQLGYNDGILSSEPQNMEKYSLMDDKQHQQDNLWSISPVTLSKRYAEYEEHYVIIWIRRKSWRKKSYEMNKPIYLCSQMDYYVELFAQAIWWAFYKNTKNSRKYFARK